MKTLDILIPCRNEITYLHILLNSLRNLVIPDNLSVRFIFSDNHSTDGTYENLMLAALNNKTVYLQEKDIGGWGNISFLMNKIEADYFMFIDGHDYISQFYLRDFYYETISRSSDSAYIGNVITLQENKSRFYPIHIQQKYIFSKFKQIRCFQLCLFLFHNSIYHAIFPTKTINMSSLINAKSWSLDHLITHAGLANNDLRYLPNSYYIRRYREILADDFTHDVSGEMLTRKQRGMGESDLTINDLNITNEIIDLFNYKNRLINAFIKLFIDGKSHRSKFSIIVYRISRFFASRIMQINPLKSIKKPVPREIYDEVTVYETN